MGYNKMKKYLIVLFLIFVCVSIINSQERCKNDIFYQYIENKESNEISLNVIKQSAYFDDYVIQLNKIIYTLEANIKNFQNPYYVAKEITLNKNKEIEITKITKYRLVYEPDHPLAQNEGIECGYVRYYSSNLDSDKYWYEFYLKVRRLLLTTE
mgnify:FL=1